MSAWDSKVTKRHLSGHVLIDMKTCFALHLDRTCAYFRLKKNLYY